LAVKTAATRIHQTLTEDSLAVADFDYIGAVLTASLSTIAFKNHLSLTYDVKHIN
jgi:hypothetical protein